MMTTVVHAQQRLVLNGAYIRIANGANLVIGNASSNALVRNSGHIITEGQNNNLIWNMGTGTGTYTIPLGYGTDYIPLSFTKTAGSGNGYFVFSTYHTGWNNSAYLPAGVSNVSYNGIDNSAYTIDRFWKINAAGYTTKPAISNLSFSYLDAELTAAGNSITESTLGAQRWNPNINDWGDFIPGVALDTANNKLTVSNVSGANLFSWWTLPGLNGNHFLPVELTSFSGTCRDGSVQIVWTTASELNNDHFELESSPDGINWSLAETVAGAGSSDQPRSYTSSLSSVFSETYYRLKQLDLNGHSFYADIIKISCDAPHPFAVTEVYPNPSDGAFQLRNAPEGGTLSILNASGAEVYAASVTDASTALNLQFLSNGTYLLRLEKDREYSQYKLVIQK